jgi:carbon monoxide dehydrogenase subunit G
MKRAAVRSFLDWMESIAKSIQIDRSVDRVFAYLDDPKSVVEWLPGMIEVRDVQGSGLGQQHCWTYRIVGLPFKGQNVVIEHVPNEKRVVQSIGSIESVWTYTTTPNHAGTQLRIQIDYTVPIPVLGKLTEKLVVKRSVRELDLALENVKDICEA